MSCTQYLGYSFGHANFYGMSQLPILYLKFVGLHLFLQPYFYKLKKLYGFPIRYPDHNYYTFIQKMYSEIKALASAVVLVL